MMKLLDGIIQSSTTELIDLVSWSDDWQVSFVDEQALVDDGLYLIVDGDHFYLQQGGQKAPGPVSVDFVHGASAHRRKFGGGKGQSIAKAVGISSAYKPTVLDATAGLGRDAFVLATLGCDVTMIERHPVVYLLLKSGLQCAQSAEDVADIMTRMKLLQGDSIGLLSNWLTENKPQPDIVYLDPMFPDNTKSAQVKKDMAILQQLHQHTADDSIELFNAAWQAKCQRLVVKRPQKAATLSADKPTFQINGKTCRFDVYQRC